MRRNHNLCHRVLLPIAHRRRFLRSADGQLCRALQRSWTHQVREHARKQQIEVEHYVRYEVRTYVSSDTYLDVRSKVVPCNPLVWTLTPPLLHRVTVIRIDSVKG